jgi:hypothetical protein
MRNTLRFDFALLSVSLVACGGAPQGAQDESSSSEAIVSEASWTKKAETAFASDFRGLPQDVPVSRADLPKGAQDDFDNWSTPDSNPVQAYSWTYKGRTGYFLDQRYNGSDSEITAIYDSRGDLLSTRDSPNGETVWVHPNGTSDDPGISQ